MIRLFFALRPPESVLDRLIDLMDGVADARWQDDEQLHLTLRFVGEVERPTAEDLVDAFQAFRARAPTVRLHGVGAFGGRGRAGALWAGLAPREPLTSLHRKVDQLCVRAGLEPERRSFTPHVTVGRLSRGVRHDGPEVRRWLAAHAALSSEPFRFDRAILYRSHLGRAGASYEAVAEAPLG
ncbi:MAG TPA: RNA 2',3'-cyclic phosphodiesterase [Sphingomonas sp.]|jgi:2'-5' RNA ligase